MMERCLARIEMSPQGGEGCARHAVAYASAQSLGTVPPRSTLSRANTIYGLVSLFMGIKRPRFATAVWGAERPGGGLGGAPGGGETGLNRLPPKWHSSPPGSL